VARAREVPGFDCEEPFAAAAARVVEVRAVEVFAHSQDVLDVDEVEHLHDMRVATRRLRAALEVFAPCFPRKRHRKALKRVKELADALGERRDRDVAIESLQALLTETPKSDQGGVEALLGCLREEQGEANEALRPHVSTKRLRKLRRRLGRLVTVAKT
jgi:CHAD domain-containing protein